MTRILPHDGLVVTPKEFLVPLSASGSGAPPPSAGPCASGGGQLKSCATSTLLPTLTSGLAAVREPRMVRERFEEQLRSLVRATSVSLRHDDEDDCSHPNVVSFDLPLEAVFDPARPVDERGGGCWRREHK